MQPIHLIPFLVIFTFLTFNINLSNNRWDLRIRIDLTLKHKQLIIRPTFRPIKNMKRRYFFLTGISTGLAFFSQSETSNGQDTSTIPVWERSLKEAGAILSPNELILWLSLTNQELLVINSTTKAIESTYPVITGKASTPTPSGVFRINSNREYIPNGGVVLAGQGYQARVSVWNTISGDSISSNSIGFHDASWRTPSELGLKNRKPNHGSRGCINMTLADALELYNKTKVGTWVLITK
jgi:hypothetical protein